jgi:hypothetical protein
MKPNRILAAALGACALTAAFTGPAQAVERGTCLPAAEMIQTLRAEGQRSVIEADVDVLNAHTLPLIMYTTNADGSRGYEVGGDRPRDPADMSRPATRIPATLCVRAQLTDVQLNAGRVVPASFRLDATMREPDLTTQARARGVGFYGDHNTTLDNGARNGSSFPTLQARIVLNGQPSRLVTVTFNATGLGGVLRSWDDGLTTQSDPLNRATFTQYGMQHASLGNNGTTTLASLDVRR